MGQDNLSMFKNLLKYSHESKKQVCKTKHAHIYEAKFRQIILLFSEDLSATQISHLTGLSRQNDSIWIVKKRQ